jgi:protein-tyrosine phosphatase
VAFQVRDNLWIGSAPPIGTQVASKFDALVLAAMEYQCGECFPGVEVACAIMNDDGSPMTTEEKKEAVRTAGTVISWLSRGLRVLVTCRAGRNRSGLVVTLSLCKGPERMTPAQAIRAVRAVRGPGALSNADFVRFLYDYCG